MGLLRAVEFALVDARSRVVGSQGRLQALLDKALAHPLDGGDTCVEGLRDALIRPARPAFGLVCLEQDLSVLDLANIGLAACEQPLKLVAFVSRERHPVLLGHGWSPAGCSPHHQNAQPLASALIKH